MPDNPQKQDKNLNEYRPPLQMNNEKLRFPVTFRLKAVMTTGQNDWENRKQLVGVFDKLKIGYLYQSKNRSSKGSYVSFTYEITLNDRETMHRLYALLKEIDNLKFAL